MNLKPRDFLVVFIFSVVGGHLLVANQEPENFVELICVPGYWPAFFGSFLIAFLVCLSILLLQRFYDWRYPWISCFTKRLVMQILFGNGLSLAIAVCLAAIYFEVRHKDIRHVDYFREDFGIVAVLILCVNLYYTCEYAMGALLQYAKPPAVLFEEELALDTQPVVSVETDESENERQVSELVLPFVSEEIAYIYHEDRTNFAVSFMGEQRAVFATLAKLELVLGENYFRLQKGFIVNKEAISSVMHASSRRLVVILNTPYFHQLDFVEVNGVKTNRLTVPQRQVKEFRRWMSANIC